MNTTASATLNGVATTFIPSTRPTYMTTPVVASINVTIPLDRADLVALLYFCAADRGFEADSADDDYVRLLIVDTAVNGGLSLADEMNGEIANLAADDARQERVAFCRRRVAELFPEVPEQKRRPNRRRAAAPAAAGEVSDSRELVTA